MAHASVRGVRDWSDRMKQAALPFAIRDLPTDTILAERHYLGPSARGSFTYRDDFGVIVFASPASRRLPKEWLELARWCLTGEKNGGSRQWSLASKWIANECPKATTVVSYSDPSVGHTGSLYRACNWIWAPTWHRMVPPPSLGGSWDGKKKQEIKDRWIWVIREDPNRERMLSLDSSYERRFPGAGYREPKFRKGNPIRGTGGGDYARWGAHAR